METLLAIVAGALVAAGLYLMMRRSLVKLVLGLVLLGHAANLVIFTAGRLTRDEPPLIPYPPDEVKTLAETAADPLPQALILTAIVIGFGMQAFAMVLLNRAYQAVQTDNMDSMNTTDTVDSKPDKH
jgi:multicomponent Na+:H+ antiporter subunit C